MHRGLAIGAALLGGALMFTPGGCGAPAVSPAPEPVQLVAVMLLGTHAGDRGIEVVPAAPAHAPVSCVVYLDGLARPDERCTVNLRTWEWEGIVYPWSISASWTGLGQFDDATISRLGVIGFDEQGSSTVVWAGRIHPSPGHVTE